MFPYKKDVAITVMYVALNKTAGLTDVSMKVYDEAGGLFDTVAMTEVVSNGGLYMGTFTPDADGSWRARIQSVVNHDDVQRLFEVNLVGIDDVNTLVTTIDGNVTSIKGTVEATALDVTSIKGTVESTASDLIAVASDVTSIKLTVESIDEQINPGGYIL